jgi:tetratricopeptide (TPR) repeat protein
MMAFAGMLTIVLLGQTPAGNEAAAAPHVKKGQKLLRDEKFAEARAEFRAAIVLDPMTLPAHYGVGQASMALKDYPAAVAAYEQARNVYGKLASGARGDAGRAREEHINQLRARIDEIRRAGGTPDDMRARIQHYQRQLDDAERGSAETGVLADTTPAPLSLSLGSAHLRNDNLPAAERAYRDAIAADPKLGEAHNNLAALYAMTGRKAEAERAVRAAEKAGFRVNPKLKEDIKRMELGAGNLELGAWNSELGAWELRTRADGNCELTCGAPHDLGTVSR